MHSRQFLLSNFHRHVQITSYPQNRGKEVILICLWIKHYWNSQWSCLKLTEVQNPGRCCTEIWLPGWASQNSLQENDPIKAEVSQAASQGWQEAEALAWRGTGPAQQLRSKDTAAHGEGGPTWTVSRCVMKRKAATNSCCLEPKMWATPCLESHALDRACAVVWEIC